ncbi:hypothetical protein L798_06877 [Zootermopsis nevadensis]|uniref:Uncharacterized protein n=1 Tax=Zootermopsis nevadensis TaxID=136037 RepID=A0A067RGL3_ZOONE|nr:hypothetical protein L798_06877 [Zootermopsis nevadensis]
MQRRSIRRNQRKELTSAGCLHSHGAREDIRVSYMRLDLDFPLTRVAANVNPSSDALQSATAESHVRQTFADADIPQGGRRPGPSTPAHRKDEVRAEGTRRGSQDR